MGIGKINEIKFCLCTHTHTQTLLIQTIPVADVCLFVCQIFLFSVIFLFSYYIQDTDSKMKLIKKLSDRDEQLSTLNAEKERCEQMNFTRKLPVDYYFDDYDRCCLQINYDCVR